MVGEGLADCMMNAQHIPPLHLLLLVPELKSSIVLSSFFFIRLIQQ